MRSRLGKNAQAHAQAHAQIHAQIHAQKNMCVGCDLTNCVWACYPTLIGFV